MSEHGPAVSVIVPTLDEAANLDRLLGDLRRQTAAHELIVADGGSRDDTLRIAEAFGAKLVRGAPNRGAQLRRGAAAARGEILFFLHADSWLPGGALERIEETMSADPHLVGGNFRVVFDGDSGFSRWLTGFYAWFRGRGLYYGDSGVFVRRGVYRAIGGVRPIALMEDFDFTRRLERAGPTCCIAEPSLVTSSRRFYGRHPVAIVSAWLAIHALYYLKVSPDRLAQFYYRMGP